MNEKCVICGAQLLPGQTIWSRVDSRDNLPAREGMPPEFDMGFQPFGRTCYAKLKKAMR